MVRIIVFRFGRIPEEELRSIVGVMEECYVRLMPHNVSLVDLYVFESSSLAGAVMMRERMDLGISPTQFIEETFFAMHDAWRGIPRISIFLDKLRPLPELVKIGGIRHEVGHTVLHGSLEYYLLALPPSLLRAADELNIPIEYARSMLYLISIAVKDCEVTRLLYSHGYVEDQAEYVKFLLKDNEDEVLSWSLYARNRFSRALHLASILKVVGCSAPLLSDSALGNDIRGCLARYLSYLPKRLSEAIMDLAERDFMDLGEDTIQNINRVMEKYVAILGEVLRD